MKLMNVLVFLGFLLDIANLLSNGLKCLLVICILRLQLYLRLASGPLMKGC